MSLSELLLRVEIMWQMWNETIFLQTVLPRRIGFPPFFSCTLYHLKQDPKGNYYMFLVFWVLSLKKYWKLTIKEDLHLEQVKCYVIKKTCELPGNVHWVIIQIRSSSGHPKSAKNFLRLLFSSSTAHLNYGLYAEN